MRRQEAIYSGQPQRMVTVWDLPTRMFHWSLVTLMGLSWWSVENGQIDLHLWSGYGVLFLILFRVLWGIVGGTTARFSTFVMGPRELFAYIRRLRTSRPIGHNPIGALSVVAMLTVIALQLLCGLFLIGDDLTEGPLTALVSYETSEWAFQWHQWLFNIILLLVALHILAILFYVVVLGKRLVRPMISGRVKADPEGEGFRHASPAVAIAVAAIAIAATAWIAAGAPPFGD